MELLAVINHGCLDAGFICEGVPPDGQHRWIGVQFFQSRNGRLGNRHALSYLLMLQTVSLAKRDRLP